MSWLTDIFSKGVSDVVKEVGTVIDDVHTSKEEKMKLKSKLQSELTKLKKIQLSAMMAFDKEVSDRHKADMISDSWLSKNVRPLVLIFLTLAIMVLAYLSIFVLSTDKVELIKPWLSLFTVLMTTVYAFYFGSRGKEKVEAIKNKG